MTTNESDRNLREMEEQRNSSSSPPGVNITTKESPLTDIATSPPPFDLHLDHEDDDKKESKKDPFKRDSYESSELSDVGDDDSEAETDKMDFLDDENDSDTEKVSDLHALSKLTELARMKEVDSDFDDEVSENENGGVEEDVLDLLPDQESKIASETSSVKTSKAASPETNGKRPIDEYDVINTKKQKIVNNEEEDEGIAEDEIRLEAELEEKVSEQEEKSEDVELSLTPETGGESNEANEEQSQEHENPQLDVPEDSVDQSLQDEEHQEQEPQENHEIQEQEDPQDVIDKPVIENEPDVDGDQNDEEDEVDEVDNEAEDEGDENEEENEDAESGIKTNDEEINDSEAGEEDEEDENKEEDDADLNEQRKLAIDELVSIEELFAQLRDKLYQDKLSLLERELQLCLEGSHPELSKIYFKVNGFYQESLKLANFNLSYNLKCIDNETIATRTSIHQDFLKKLMDSKNDMITDTTSLWYKINKERNQLDQIIPDYNFSAIPQIPNVTVDDVPSLSNPEIMHNGYEHDPFEEITQPLSKKVIKQNTMVELVHHRNRINQQLGVLNGLVQFHGFPAAINASLQDCKEVASAELLLKRATEDEINDDLKAMGITL